MEGQSITRVLLLLLLAACPNKGRAIEDARSVKPIRESSEPSAHAAAPSAAPGSSSSGAAPAEQALARGDVQIRVEWKQPPAVARASAGRTPCGTAAAPAVSPTTTWGIPEAIVMIDAGGSSVEGQKKPDDSAARIAFDGCAFSPRIVATSGELIVASATDAPAQLELKRVQAAKPLVAAAADSPPRAVQLPVIGHEVEVPLRSDSLYALTAGSATATIVVAPTPYYAITEANGQVVIRDVPTGTYPVIALIPARGGQPARTAAGVVTVARNALAEVTVAVVSSP